VDLQLKGKKAFVSGSSSGIGLGIALEPAAEGCDVVVHGRDRARAQETVSQVEARGVKAALALGDLADEQEAERVCKVALDAFGSIDILINNCGRTLRYDSPDWSELKSDEWIKSFEVNFIAGIRLAPRFVPGMKGQGLGAYRQCLQYDRNARMRHSRRLRRCKSCGQQTHSRHVKNVGSAWHHGQCDPSRNHQDARH
jgi:3-oxoacyl-[acyl-carrier protein] reductase